MTFDASNSTGTIVYYDWYFLEDGNWAGFNRTTEKVFSTRLLNGPGSVIWGLQVVGPFGQLSGIVAVESPTEQPTAAPIVFNQQEQEQPETVETTTYSLKSSSDIFGLFVEFINGQSQPEKIHLNAGAIVIIKAVPGSIQAPIDVIITAVGEELN
ncbi:MAG: hypothetical protein KF746_27510 [Chitinophagaceae bacterium]|nr:hypothetical protein [Chitinophagaceae bacterium]